MDLREHDLRFPESWIPATPAGLQRAQTAVGNWRESVVDFSFDLNTCDEAAAAATATPACFSFPGSPFQDWHQIPYANFPAPEINAGPHLLPQNLSSTMPMFFTGESPVLGVDQLGTQLLLNRKAVLNSDLFLRGAVYPSLGAFGPFSPTPAPVTPEKTKFMQGERGAAAQRGLLIPNGKGPITLCFDGGASAPSPPPQEIKTTETGTNEGVDFDKTPPRKPRRKKHRPKVIREGKPARTPKQSTPKQSTPKPATPQQSTPKLPAKPSPESAVNASGKRSYTRRNSEVNPSSERSQASERREPLPTKRRLEFPPEGDSQPVESKSTPNPLTGGALAACLNSPDIPSLQLQPSRRELIRWNLKKLARMRDGAFFHVDSSLTFEAPHPSNIDQSASNLKEVPKKKRTERTRNGKTHLEFEEVKQVAQSTEKSQQNSQEKFANGHDMDLIIRRMESLDINGQQSSLTNKETALVPYGSTGAIVSYEGQFHQLKKVRPKVVLDEETHRMWNLLMGKEVNGADVAGKNKEKWWEEERRVFRGRIDSFIAKMHLVQGDRRFSPWKGSVLDSVIGVFLTQNVSDHLSSSAFMAMSARFPPVSVKESPADKSSVLHDLVNTRQDPIILKEQEAKSVGDIDPLESQHSEPAVISPEEADFLFMNNNPCDLESKISFTELLEMATSRNLRDLYIYGNERPADTERFPAVLPEESSMGSGPCLSGLTAVEAVKLNPESGGHNQVLEDSGQKKKKGRLEEKEKLTDWDELRREACRTGGRGGSSRKERSSETMDSLDWEAVKRADVDEISSTIRERGMNNMLAERIKGFLKRLEMEHGSIDLEWLRDVPADKAKDFLLSIKGLGLKSVECVRLLTLHHLAFPVDTNVGRICVRLGWVPLQPLPESLQLHLLELYPMLETIQKYLWPRLCTLDQPTLYELHYQLITFGKVFCTKSRPNCNACPMRGECKHFASAFASARLALPGPEERRMTTSSLENHRAPMVNPYSLPQLECPEESSRRHCEPIIEEPDSPELESSQILDIEDGFDEDPDEIPVIRLNIEEFSQNIQDYMHQNSNDLQNVDLSKALVMISQQTASIPVPKLKNVSRLRTEHQVYELPDSHSLLEGLDQREAQDPCHYLLAIWSPGETAQSVEPPKSCGGTGELCDQKTCFSCNSVREAQNQIVRGTLLIPCRTAMRGSFPLNGTYFQVNEVFADHESSLVPINVPRSLIWNLPRRTVYFGTSIPTIFRGLAIQEIQNCFWRGFVCVRGFDRKTRGPRPLMARLHFPASKVTRNKRAAERNDE